MSKSKDEGMTFLKKSTGNEQTKTVSARVPASVYTSFQNAVGVAAKNGYDLSITDVVIEAMKMATNQARKQFGIDAFQTDLPLSDKPKDNKQDVKPAQEPTRNTLSVPAAGKAPEAVKK